MSRLTMMLGLIQLLASSCADRQRIYAHNAYPIYCVVIQHSVGQSRDKKQFAKCRMLQLLLLLRLLHAIAVTYYRISGKPQFAQSNDICCISYVRNRLRLTVLTVLNQVRIMRIIIITISSSGSSNLSAGLSVISFVTIRQINGCVGA